MTLSRPDVAEGLVSELEAFEGLVRSLSPSEMSRSSRCAGWSAGDVAAHLIGSMTDVVEGRFDGLGTPEVTEREVLERRGTSPDELADELARARKASVDLLAVFDDDAWNGPAPGGYTGTLGDGVEALWFDAYLHADDIRDAIGRQSVGGPGVRASLSHLSTVLTQQGWGDATLTLDGEEPFDIGAGGEPIEGDALEFIKAATGRGDPKAFGFDERLNIYR